MRVVGHDGAPRRGLRRRHDPAVASLGRRIAFRLGDPLDSFRLLRSIPRDAYALRRELEDLQHVGRQARVESFGNPRVPAVGEPESDRVDFDVLRLAQRVCARDFGAQVAREPVRANADHIVRGPLGRLIAELPELPRRAIRMRIEPVHVCIDAGDKALSDGLELARLARTVDAPLAVHVAAIQEQPGRAVLLHERGTEDVGELSQAAASPQVDLEEPVTCGIDALGEEEVRLALRVDVRNTPPVDTNFDSGFQPRHSERLDWHCAFPREGR